MKTKRIAALLMAGVMVLSQGMVFGEELTGEDVEVLTSEEENALTELDDELPVVGDGETSGLCGASVYWEYAHDVLTIYGEGDMYADFNYSSATVYSPGGNQPWKKLPFMVVSINPGVTSIGENAFSGHTFLGVVVIPASMQFIWDNAFASSSNISDVYYEGTQAQWNKVILGKGNGYLENAIIHYNYKMGDPTPRTKKNTNKTLKAVTNLKAKATGTNKVTVSWTGDSNSDGYLIVGLNKNRKGTQIGYTGKASWTDTSAESDGWNFYWVLPFYKDGSNKIIRGPLGNYTYAMGRTIGEVPSFKSQSTRYGVKLTWGKADNANAYIILSKDGVNAPFNTPVMVPGDTAREYYDRTVPKGVTRYYWIYGAYVDSAGNTLMAGSTSGMQYGIGL